MTTRKAIFILLVIAAFVGLAGGALNLYIAFYNNTMDEFVCGDEINYRHATEWFLFFALLYGISALAFELAFFLFIWPFKRR